MSFYFVCPGQAAVTETQVQCTAAITTFDAGWQTALSMHDKQAIVDALFVVVGTLAAFWLIKKAFDL